MTASDLAQEFETPQNPFLLFRRELDKLQDHARLVEAASLQALAVRETLMDATAELRRQYDVDGLLKPLRELPGQTRQQRISVASAQAVLDEAFDLLKVAEANIEMAVGQELGDNGKPRYSNAEMRAAEVRTRRQFDSEYQEAKRHVQGSQELLVERQAELEFLLQQFETAKIAAQLTAAQIAALQR